MEIRANEKIGTMPHHTTSIASPIDEHCSQM